MIGVKVNAMLSQDMSSVYILCMHYSTKSTLLSLPRQLCRPGLVECFSAVVLNMSIYTPSAKRVECP